MRFFQPHRYHWESEFPTVLIHASESDVKQHPAYPAAKSGDVDAAFDLVLKTINVDVVNSFYAAGW